MVFDDDLYLGNTYEKKAINYIKHESYKIMQGKFKDYDIEFIKNDKIIKVEVKCDRLAMKTGNIAIEYKYNNSDSGINTTTAKYWIYFIIGSKDIVYKIPVKKLRKICPKYRSVCGGDNKASLLYLIPINKLDKYIINEISY